MRRVINVPTRGIGKVVLDSLARIELSTEDEAPLLAAAGLRPEDVPNSLWSHLLHGLDQDLLPTRSIKPLGGFRNLLAELAEIGHDESVSIALGKVLDRTRYLSDLREHRNRRSRGANRKPHGTRVCLTRVRVTNA